MKNLKLVPCIAFLLVVFCVQSQDLKIVKANLSHKTISVKSSENTVADIVQQLQTNSPKLNFKMEGANTEGSYTKAALVAQIMYKGKEVGKTIQNGIPLFPGNNTLTLSHFQVEKLLIETLEKQSTSSKQRNGRSLEVKQNPLQKKLPSTETKGFVRRQIGRIPKDQYEVRLSIMPESNDGTIQPVVFLVNII